MPAPAPAPIQDIAETQSVSVAATEPENPFNSIDEIASLALDPLPNAAFDTFDQLGELSTTDLSGFQNST